MFRDFSIGLIGAGGFGHLLIKHLCKIACLYVYDVEPHRVPERFSATFDSVAGCDVVILAVPVQNMEQVLDSLSSRLQPKALVIDVCSVKKEVARLMEKTLPTSVDVLATHPLFGPQSAKDGLDGHTVVLCPVRISDVRLNRVQKILLKMGLQTIFKSPDEHDREMAMVQALTHFIARGVMMCGIKESEMSTTAFGHLCKVSQMLGEDSWDLFATIQLGNPYAKEMRGRLLASLHGLDDLLKM